jgi:hypothetical protein
MEGTVTGVTSIMGKTTREMTTTNRAIKRAMKLVFVIVNNKRKTVRFD